jgi:hypothetical protein
MWQLKTTLSVDGSNVKQCRAGRSREQQTLPTEAHPRSSC